MTETHKMIINKGDKGLLHSLYAYMMVCYFCGRYDNTLSMIITHARVPAATIMQITFVMLYYTILYYTILYYNILYYTILYYTILYYTLLC